MTTNARDEKWSEWIDWTGGECPLERGEMCCVEYRSGEVRNNIPAGVDGGLVSAGGYDTTDTYWRNDRKSVDIIAYRYKIKEPESGIAEADEEECLQLAYERMGDESVKVSVEELQDNVNKPKHYQLREGYEVYDLRQDLAAKAANGGATYDQYSDWDRAIEYIIRMWGKNRLEDAKKGRWYLDKLIWKLEAEESAR